MTSKKGAFVYQQIELTTAEWATNTDLYPVSTWLFERLESGKFNMKLSDGVHLFTELPAVMQDIVIAVKTNNDTTYILTITTALGSFDTPNLKGQNGATYDDTDLRQEIVNNLATAKTYTNEQIAQIVGFTISVVSSLPATGQIGTIYLVPKSGSENDVHNEYIWVATDSKFELIGNTIIDLTNYVQKEVGKGLFSGSYNDLSSKPTIPTIPGVATPTANGLMSAEDKQLVDDALILTDIETVTSLSVLSPIKYSQKYTYITTTAQAINFANVPAEGFECMLAILNSTASNVTQAIPNAVAWQCEETSLVIPAGKIGFISIQYIHGIYCVRVGL